MKNCPLIVSYYTKNTSYEKEALFLKKSCEKLHLRYHIEGIDSLGSWSKNCCFKPTFLQEQLLQHKRDLLWIDCDAIIVKRPYIFAGMREDIAVKYIEDVENSHPSKVISCTLFIKYNPKVIKLLGTWEAQCARALQKDENTWDQTVLRDLLLVKDRDFSFSPLPKSYCQIYDRLEGYHDLNESVIIHFQASRLAKHDGQLSSLFTHLYLENKQTHVQTIFDHFDN